MSIIFTIGYSNLSTERFSEILKKHNISAIADVRSSPYSKMFPNYNRENMPEWLKENHIRYVYLGEELGPRSKDSSLYKDEQIQFDLLSQTDAFKKGIARLKNGASDHNIAIMCAEKDPMTCHRSLLVAQFGMDQDLDFVHIHQDGSLEPHIDMLSRAMKHYKILPDMLTDESSCQSMAHSKLCQQYAYRKSPTKNNGYEP